MTTDIKVLDEKGEIVSWDDLAWEDTGIGNVAPSFPIIKIVQGTSTMEGAGKHGGDFWRSDTEEFYSELDVVPLLRRETRALFEQGNNSPICMSPDGVAPLSNQPLWMSTNITTIDMGQKGIHPVPEFAPENCAACPFSQWGEDGTPPLCGSSDVLLVDVDGDLRAALTAAAPVGIQSRVFAVQSTVSDAILVVPLLLAGVAAETVGARMTLAALGTLCSVTCLLMWHPRFQLAIFSRRAEQEA